MTVPPAAPGPSRRSRSLARWFDDLVRIPGTNRGIGLDALIGLVPGIGDAAGSALTSLIMVEAMQSKVPVSVLARMALNLIIDALLGLVPFIGDVLDVLHRANRKNLILLERALEKGHRSQLGPVAYVAAAWGLIAFAILVGVASLVFFGWLVWKLITG